MDAYVARTMGPWIALAVIIFAVLMYFAWKYDRKKKAQMLAIARAYQDALDHLAQHPTDPGARVACLERGRAFYALTIPDTFTLVVGEKTFGAQDYQNNTAGREARIAADIEARVGHVKVARS
jgi:hypothetical protein